MVALGAIFALGIQAHIGFVASDTVWQYNFPWTEGWVDYVRFNPYDKSTYQSYEDFKKYVDSNGGEARVKPK